MLAEVPAATALQINQQGKIESPKYEEEKSVFVLSPNTTLSINEDVILTVSSDVVLSSNILGEGIFLIKGNLPLLLDAHNFKIDKLHLESNSGLELRSPLTIGKELSIIEGNLYLNDFNITLANRLTRIHVGRKGKLVFNGKGVVFMNQEPLVSFNIRPISIKAPCYCSLKLTNLNNNVTIESYSSFVSIYKPFQLVSPKPPP